MRALREAVADVEMTTDQRCRLNEFFNQKEIIGGEMGADDFEKLVELGAGNGGVVSKVKHKKSSIIMARKVNNVDLLDFLILDFLKPWPNYYWSYIWWIDEYTTFNSLSVNQNGNKACNKVQDNTRAASTAQVQLPLYCGLLWSLF